MPRIAIFILLLVAPVFGKTVVLDATLGNDNNAGTSAAPWRTYAKFRLAMTTGNIAPGDTVLWRPGRYAVCDTLPSVNSVIWGGGAGGTITMSVDTSVPGDVEIHGGAHPGICNVPAWTQASQCTVGAFVGAACDVNADCGSNGVCSSVPLPGVYWTYATGSTNNEWWGGLNASVAYQPSKTPGGAPKIYERLWAQSGVTWVKMPVFTPGHAQAFPYAVGPPNGGTWGAGPVCTGRATPFWCCTGAGTGTCDQGRIYVQTESGTIPSSVADSTYDNVEFPYVPQLINNGDSTLLLRNFTVTNNGNGRIFHFWWALTNIIFLRDADTITFEDFDIAYLARLSALAHMGETGGNANASNFPPYIKGDSYMISGYPPDQGNVVRNTIWRRGKVHGTCGNEAIHFIGGNIVTHANHLIENVEIGDTPFAVQAGQVETNLTRNTYTGQVTKSWPPATYSAWSTVFPNPPGFWGPLGGGGNTDGAIITSAQKQTVRNCYIHDAGLLSFFESGGSGELLFENNIVDLARMYYSDAGGGIGVFPNVLVTRCGSPSLCGGLEGRLSLSVPSRYDDAGVKGAVVRNNVFTNVYANAIRTGWFNNGDAAPTLAPSTPPMIVNNTFWVRDDYRSASRPGLAVPVIWFQEFNGGFGLPLPDSTGRKLIFKNNIIFRDVSSVAGLPLVSIGNTRTAEIDTDYNLYGTPFSIWNIGATNGGTDGTSYNTFTAYKSALVSNGVTGAEAHSVSTTDPQFQTASPPYTNLSIKITSPAYQTGTDLSASPAPFNTDITGATRPAGQWSIGAYQGPIPDGTTTTAPTTSTGTTSSSTSSTVTSTTSGPTTTTSTTLLTGSAPQDWTLDSETVAWWPFDGDTLNHSPVTTYCNPASNGDLHFANCSSDLSFTAGQKIQGSQSVALAAGSGQIAQNTALSGAADCLRASQPSQFTITMWGRATTAGIQAGCTPTNPGPCFYTQFLTDMSQVGVSQPSNKGWMLMFRPYDQNGNIGFCLGKGSPGTTGENTECPALAGNISSGWPPDGGWHFIVGGYNGSAGFIGSQGRAQERTTGPYPFTKNDGNNGLFEMPHQPGNCGAGYPNQPGNYDAIWFTGRVLTDQQTCRVRSLHPTGELGWCDAANPATYATCTGAAGDCGGRVGACNTTIGRCVGLLGKGVAGENFPAVCNDITDLPACNVSLTGGTTTSIVTTSTTSSTTTSSTIPVVSPRGVNFGGGNVGGVKSGG